MKKHLHKNYKNRLRCLLASVGLAAVSSVSPSAGTFQTDFNSGIPGEISLFGSSQNYDHSTGGVGNSGVLKLTEAIGSQQGGAIISNFDPDIVIGGFEANFDLYIGSGNGADGFSFFFGDFADAAYGEEGPANIEGLTITFDVFNSGGAIAEAPAIDVKWNNNILFHRLVGAASTTTGAQPLGSATTIRTQPTQGGPAVYWPVKVRVDTDGTLDLVYNNIVVFTNLPVFRPITQVSRAPEGTTGPRFGFGARTGGSFDAHFVDNLRITTFAGSSTQPQPQLAVVKPIQLLNQSNGQNPTQRDPVIIALADQASAIRPETVVVRYNNTVVTPAVYRRDGVTTIHYTGVNGLLPTGQATVSVSYETTSGFSNTFSYSFVVNAATVPAPSLAQYKLPAVDTSKPGFSYKLYQMEVNREPGTGLVINAERQIARGYIDPATGQPYPNLAGITEGIDEDVINWNQDAMPGIPTNGGSFPDDEPVPGISEGWSGNDRYVFSIETILELKAGLTRFGVNSDDGFRLSIGRGPGDVVGAELGTAGNKGFSDVLVDVVIPEDGFYPVRLMWWETGGGSGVEFFVQDVVTGHKTLVNDLSAASPVRAFRASPVAPPYASRILPTVNYAFVAADQDILVDIQDAGFNYIAGSAVLKINGVTQNITEQKSGGVTTLLRDSSLTNLLPPGANNVELTYSYSDGTSTVSTTDRWTFWVAQYGVIPAANRVDAAQLGWETGFRARVHQLARTANTTQGDSDRFPGDGNRMPRPEVQLEQGFMNTATGAPFPNVAIPDLDGDHIYHLPSTINLNLGLTGTAPNRFLTTPNSGLFGGDEAMPGLGNAGDPERAALSNGGLDNYVAEFTTHLDLKAGAYLFAFNSDDGFVATSGPDAHDKLGTLLGFFNGGRGNAGSLPTPTGSILPTAGVNTGNTLFGVVVPQDGVYPIRIVYWQGGGGVNAEFIQVNQLDGQVALVNSDTAPWAVRAYSSYNGPARAHVKYHVTPTPWDNMQQQLSVSPLRFWGRTPNSVDSTDIYNWTDTAAAVLAMNRAFADTPIGAIFANAAGKTIRMLLNGAEVTPSITTSGSETVVSYKPSSPLPSGSTNTASLVYEGSTNSWTFQVQNYATVASSAARPITAANPENRGFRAKVVQASTGQANTVARAEAQLAGTPANVATPGPGPEGSYILPGIINWNTTYIPGLGLTPAPVGNFQDNTLSGWPFQKYVDQPVPGITGAGLSGDARFGNIAAEVFAFLELPAAGYYKLGVNGDDGWAVSVATPGQTDGQVLFSINRGAGSADLPFSFTVPQPGLYPIRLVWYQGGGGGNLEFFSYDDVTGSKIPINDPNNPRAIRAYWQINEQVPAPELSIARSGSNVVITWTNGGTLQASTDLSTWSNVGTGGSHTEAATSSAKFFRVVR